MGSVEEEKLGQNLIKSENDVGEVYKNCRQKLLLIQNLLAGGRRQAYKHDRQSNELEAMKRKRLDGQGRSRDKSCFNLRKHAKIDYGKLVYTITKCCALSKLMDGCVGDEGEI